MFDWVAIEELKPYPDNTRKHSKKQIDSLAEGIRYYGWRWPILVSKQTGFIVSGHGRLLAAQKLGLKEVPVLFQDFDSDDQETAFRIFDNGVHDQSQFDFAQINMEIAKLDGDFSLEMLGIPDLKVDVSEKEKKPKICPHCGEDIAK